MRIICPTYWYPQHATDTQATYVHDINRHLVRRGHSVTVVTPGDPSHAAGLTLRRRRGRPVPARAAARSDLWPGGPEPGELAGQVRPAWPSWPTTWRRSIGPSWRRRARAGADVIHAHWAIPTGPAAVHGRPAARRAQRHHDARRRRLRESGAGVRLSDPLVCPSGAAMDPAPRRRADRDHRGLPAARACEPARPAESIRLVFNGTDLRRFSPARRNGSRRIRGSART